MTRSPRLFVYGTLLVPEIMTDLIGRVPPAQPAVLDGYARRLMRGEVYPGLLPAAGHCTHGCLYAGVTKSEREQLDEYEGDAFEAVRLPVRVGSLKEQAVVYIVRPELHHLLSEQRWDLQSFLARELPGFRRALGSSR